MCFVLSQLHAGDGIRRAFMVFPVFSYLVEGGIKLKLSSRVGIDF